MTDAQCQPLRIGFYLFKYHPQVAGGIDTAFVRSIRAIVQYAPHHHYTIIANEHSLDDLKKKFQDILDWVEFYIIPSKPSWNERIIYGIRRYLSKERKPYVVQRLEDLHLDILNYPHQEVFHQVKDTRIWLTLYDIQHEYYPEFFDELTLEYRKKAYAQSIQQANLIVVAADFTRDTLKNMFPDEIQRVKRIYPGFETHWGHLSPEAIATNLAPYKLPDRFIFYPANAWMHKNHAHLFAALRRLKERGIVIPLVCTGRLKEQAPATLKQLITASDLVDTVYDLGYVPEPVMQSLYQKAEMLIFPSLFEGFGFPLLEAQANECPVVCANSTTLPEVAGDGAVYFDPLDVEKIVQTLMRVWDDAQLRQRLREKGKANCERFSWEAYARELVDCFESITTK